SDSGDVLGAPNTVLVYNYVTGTISQAQRIVLEQGQWGKWTGIWVNEAVSVGADIFTASSLPDAAIRTIDNPANQTDGIGLPNGAFFVTGNIGSPTATTFRAGTEWLLGANVWAGFPVHILNGDGSIQQVNWIISNQSSQNPLVTVAVPFATTPVAGQRYVIGHINALHRSGWIDAGNELLKKQWRSIVVVGREVVGSFAYSTLVVTLEYSNDQQTVFKTERINFTMTNLLADHVATMNTVSKYVRVSFSSPVPSVGTDNGYYQFSVWSFDLRFRPLAETPR
ncbi:MAG: hypothetical protein ACREEP_13770, partial [Dongiaceae bacterium]